MAVAAVKKIRKPKEKSAKILDALLQVFDQIVQHVFFFFSHDWKKLYSVFERDKDAGRDLVSNTSSKKRKNSCSSV